MNRQSANPELAALRKLRTSLKARIINGDATTARLVHQAKAMHAQTAQLRRDYMATERAIERAIMGTAKP